MAVTIRPVTADVIRWRPDLLPAIDPLVMSDEDILIATIVESEAYRRVAQQAIHALHDERRDHERLRASHHRLIDEFRRLREQTMREAA